MAHINGIIHMGASGLSDFSRLVAPSAPDWKREHWCTNRLYERTRWCVRVDDCGTAGTYGFAFDSDVFHAFHVAFRVSRNSFTVSADGRPTDVYAFCVEGRMSHHPHTIRVTLVDADGLLSITEVPTASAAERPLSAFLYRIPFYAWSQIYQPPRRTPHPLDHKNAEGMLIRGGEVEDEDESDGESDIDCAE